MPTRDEDQAEAMGLITPILPFLHKLLNDAAEFYFGPDYSEEARATHDGRAMASCIYSRAEKQMVERVEDLPGARVQRHRQLTSLNWQGRVAVRTKKVNALGKARNYLTEQQLDYDYQMELPGIPSAFRLVAGYQLDAFNTGIERVMVTRPVGKQIWWTAQVVVLDEKAAWEDKTPPSFGGVDSIDFDAVRRARKNHGRR